MTVINDAKHVWVKGHSTPSNTCGACGVQRTEETLDEDCPVLVKFINMLKKKREG